MRGREGCPALFGSLPPFRIILLNYRLAVIWTLKNEAPQGSIIELLGAEDEVPDEDSHGWWRRFVSHVNCHRRGYPMRYRADATYPLREPWRICRLPSDQDDLETPEHGQIAVRVHVHLLARVSNGMNSKMSLYPCEGFYNDLLLRHSRHLRDICQQHS